MTIDRRKMSSSTSRFLNSFWYRNEAGSVAPVVKVRRFEEFDHTDAIIGGGKSWFGPSNFKRWNWGHRGSKTPRNVSMYDAEDPRPSIVIRVRDAHFWLRWTPNRFACDNRWFLFLQSDRWVDGHDEFNSIESQDLKHQKHLRYHDWASRFPGRVGLPYRWLRLDSLYTPTIHSHSLPPSTLQRSIRWNFKKSKPRSKLRAWAWMASGKSFIFYILVRAPWQ